MASFLAAVRAIDGFAKLNPGWDYGRGVPSTPTTCARARTVLALLHSMGVNSFNVAPGRAGGITVAAAHKAGNEVEIHCSVNGTYDLFAMADGEEAADFEGIGILELGTRLGGVNWLSKKSYTWSTANVICLTWDGSRAKLSSPRRMDLVSRLSAPNAPTRRAVAFARTFNSMPEQISAPTHQFFGDSNTRNLMPV